MNEKFSQMRILSGMEYGHDLAGSCWKRSCVGMKEWQLVTFAEDN